MNLLDIKNQKEDNQTHEPSLESFIKFSKILLRYLISCEHKMGRNKILVHGPKKK